MAMATSNGRTDSPSAVTTSTRAPVRQHHAEHEFASAHFRLADEARAVRHEGVGADLEEPLGRAALA
jgi:hypothetical protein